MKVYQAINKVQAALSKIGIAKNHTNTQGASYKFRGIDDVYNTLSPLLAEHGLCILPRLVSRTVSERPSKAGGVLFVVTVEAEYDFVAAEDGTKHTVRTFGEAMDSGDKATNKAMSAAYKYACFQAFAIPIDADDGDSETPQATFGMTTNQLADHITALTDATAETLKEVFAAAWKAAGKDKGAHKKLTEVYNNQKAKLGVV